jgi:PAS domain-containing protein
VGLGIAEIGAMVGGLIRQGRPLPVVLATLCQLFDATVKGYSSSVLLLDRTGTRVRNAAGPGLPASYMKQLESGRISWIEAPRGATINAKTPVIVLDPVSDILREGQEAAPAAAPGLRLHKVSPILSLTGEPLGIFAVYQRGSNPDVTRCHSALIPQFTHVASAAIERMRSDEALKRSAALLERTQQLSSTCCFSWRMETDEISWSKELCQLFELDPADVPVTLELISARIHSEDLPSFHEMIERARSGVSDFEFEHRLRLTDNSVKYLRVVAHGTRDQEGQLEYIGAVQDVTRSGSHVLIFHPLRTPGCDGRCDRRPQSWRYSDVRCDECRGTSCEESVTVMVKRPLVSVVDDDESVRESLPDLLRELGYSVRAFSSAEEFLASDCVGETRRPSVHARSNRVPWSACSSRSATRLCLRRSMPHFE